MPTITIPIPSGPSKRRIVELAFGDLAMAGYEFGRTPEEVNDAIDRLDALMYEWPFNLLGYVHKPIGEGEPDELSGIPFETMNGVSSGLALRLSAAMGVTLSPEARANLATATSKLYAYTAAIPTMPLAPNTIRGAGNESFLQSPFINETADGVNPVVLPTVIRSTGNITLGSSTILNVAPTDGVLGGFLVSGAGIIDGSLVTNVSGSTITISTNATATINNVALTFQDS